MSKIGVGVGEDFPIDEAAEPEAEREKCESERRRDHAARHAEWAERKRRFKDDVRQSFHEHFGDDAHHAHHHFALRAVAAAGAVALLIVIVPHLLTFLAVAIVLGAVLFAVHRHRGFHQSMPRHGDSV